MEIRKPETKKESAGVSMDNNENTNFLDSLPADVLLVFFLLGTPFPRAMIMQCETFRKAYMKEND